LGGGQDLVRIRGRHDLLGVVAEDAGDQFTGVWLSWDHGRQPGLATGKGGVLPIEPQPRLPRRGIGPVAVVTGVGQEGLNVPREIHPAGRSGECPERRSCGEDERDQGQGGADDGHLDLM
jgi:hypothetical protein